MSKSSNLFFICVFIGVAIFSFSKTISLFQENNSLNKQIRDVFKPRLAKLEEENAKTNNELAKTQNSLLAIEEESRILKEELISRKNDLKQTQALFEEKEEALTKTTNKYNELSNETNLLKDKFSVIYSEFVEMRKTLSSIDALKKVIKDLKAGSKKNKKTKGVAKKAKSKAKSKAKYRKEERNFSQDTELFGNCGYLVKDGESTYVPKVRIRVLTVEE